MKLAKMMKGVYLIGVLLSLVQHLHLVRTMKFWLYTQGPIRDAVHTDPLYLRISETTFRHAKQ